MPVDVALVTYAGLPHGADDDAPLVDALEARGARVAFACWDDPGVQWAALGLAVLRSTWDYHRRLGAFLGWADFVGGATRLVNDAATIRWNAHKRYLSELAAAGVPVVPTVPVGRGGAFVLPDGHWVLKPAVSIGADRTVRGATQADLDALVAETDVLVQPYIAEVEAGETSVVCIGGHPSHAVRKVPATGDFRTQQHHGASIALAPLGPGLASLATAVVDLLPTTPAYARVDVVETADGPLLMELELIEPTLWLTHHPAAAGVLADHLLGLLGRP